MFDNISEQYGEGFWIGYGVLTVQEYEEEIIAAVNQRLCEISSTAVEYTGIVELTIKYTVSGSKGSGMETEGYFTPSLALLQTKNGWTPGIGNGFPCPSTEELIEFMGGYR